MDPPDRTSESKKRRASVIFPNVFKKSKHRTTPAVTQPSISSSSASPIHSPPVGPEGWRASGFIFFKNVVGIVKKVSDWMPVLKSAAAGLLVVLDRIDVCYSDILPVNQSK